nr:MAG TPA: hypothetical protein [Caudoviricetes sp.]
MFADGFNPRQGQTYAAPSLRFWLTRTPESFKSALRRLFFRAECGRKEKTLDTTTPSIADNAKVTLNTLHPSYAGDETV